jgi:peptide/nickel transport system ATP-binding protein
LTVLSVENLSIDYKTQGIMLSAVYSVSFGLEERNVLGIVGESGSGKTTIGLAIMRLLPKNAQTRGVIQFEDTNVTQIRQSDASTIRGTGITMIFQEPMTSLNPVMRVSDQLAEAITIRRERSLTKNPTKAYELSTYSAASEGDNLSPSRARFGLSSSSTNSPPKSKVMLKEVVDALRKVRISDPERTASKYPHELSGGERQRVMIAMAYLLRPKVLIADEPTTALDVTTQAQILKLMMELRDEIGTAILLISHDLLVVGQIADKVAVMYAGEVMEIALTSDIFAKPMHPYTQGLVGSIPKGYKGEGRVNPIPPSPQGEVPQMLKGCKFHSRCSFAMEKCRVSKPELREVESNHYVACYLY